MPDVYQQIVNDYSRLLDNHIKGTSQSQKRMLDVLPNVAPVNYLNQ